MTEISEDLLANEDHFYSGLDRLLFISCHCCYRYSPFLVYLPPNEDFTNVFSGLRKDDALIFCAKCLPAQDILQQFYPSVDQSAINNGQLLELLKGFEYCNPFYGKLAHIQRVLLTVHTRLNGTTNNSLEAFGSLPLDERLQKLYQYFPAIHRMVNVRYSGLQELSRALADKNDEIERFYSPEVEIVPMEVSQDAEPTPKETPPLEGQQRFSFDPLEGCSSPTVKLASKASNLRILSSSESHLCDICQLTENNTLHYGPFIEKQYSKQTFRCHYFCLLSGTHIMQQGGDNAGIFGFLMNDIVSSFPKYRKTVCTYCGERSAPINCAAENCTRSFHYICGYKNNCLTQFHNEFRSFCHEHLPIKHEVAHAPEQLCWICWDEMLTYHPLSSFCAVCEPDEANNPKNLTVEYTWLHRECLQRFAYEAGYYFRCPNCWEKEEFTTYARLHGIFVPMRDASWELEGNYKDLHQCDCTAENCQIPNGKKGKPKTSPMIGCKACGGETMHQTCAGVSDPNEYVCSKCMDATFIKLF